MEAHYANYDADGLLANEQVDFKCQERQYLPPPPQLLAGMRAGD